jgi:hypothetical protein
MHASLSLKTRAVVGCVLLLALAAACTALSRTAMRTPAFTPYPTYTPEPTDTPAIPLQPTLTPVPPTPTIALTEAQVVAVVDGDTIRVLIHGRRMDGTGSD